MNYAPSRAQVRKIKTLQGLVFGDDDAAYREMLQGQAGVKSCKDLRGPKIDRVIRHLERCAGQVGDKRSAGETPAPTGRRGKRGPLRATEEQLEKIKVLWNNVSRVVWEYGTESRQAAQALNKFLLRRFKVAAPEWLTLPQAQDVIEALKEMDKRREAAGQGPGKALNHEK